MITQSQLKDLLQKQRIGLTAPEVCMESAEGPIFHVQINGRSYALEQWQQARQLVTHTGLYPVIVNTRDVQPNSLLFEHVSPEIASTELLRQAEEMDAMDVLAKHFSQPEEIKKNVPKEIFAATEPETYLPWLSRIRGSWPDYADPESFDPDDFFTPEERLEVPRKEETVSLCFLPVEQSWHVPALLRYGNWNYCPSPVEHSCVHRSWQQRYGAEVVCLSGDIIECFVARPPMTQQVCRQLALEQFAYCNDIVDQGYRVLEELAARLLRNKTWYFWWD